MWDTDNQGGTLGIEATTLDTPQSMYVCKRHVESGWFLLTDRDFSMILAKRKPGQQVVLVQMERHTGKQRFEIHLKNHNLRPKQTTSPFELRVPTTIP